MRGADARALWCPTSHLADAPPAVLHAVWLCSQVGWNFVMLGMDPGEYTSPPEEGIYIQGLFLEGCGWDPGCKQLCESRPKVRHCPVFAGRMGARAVASLAFSSIFRQQVPVVGWCAA